MAFNPLELYISINILLFMINYHDELDMIDLKNILLNFIIIVYIF